ncbi:hypothetical protein VN12_18270 [Pirellula sp. SH-Sr6A]|nr:hypothetical protein VN12_18270 [Pirellula sp. SH-Sr6A]
MCRRVGLDFQCHDLRKKNQGPLEQEGLFLCMAKTPHGLGQTVCVAGLRCHRPAVSLANSCQRLHREAPSARILFIGIADDEVGKMNRLKSGG